VYNHFVNVNWVYNHFVDVNWVYNHFNSVCLISPCQTQDRNEQLTEILQGYSIHGLPRMPELYTLGRPHYDATQFHIERHWSDIVANHEVLTKRQREQQEAIWELLTTELEYIRKLRVIIDVCVLNS